MMNPKQLENFRKNLRQLEREIGDQLKDQTECCGVSMAQCHALMEIGGIDQISIGDIAEYLNLDKSTLSRTVDNLVKLGLVNRDTNMDDRRYMKIYLSDQGKKVYDDINEQCDTYYQEMFNLIPEDKHEQVIESMSLLVDAMLKLKQTQEKDTGKTNSCCKKITE
jgi:DNA-binding MarR family transcriptional regulator